MPSIYRTVQDDRLDRICRGFYGSERAGTVEAVLAANPHLADRGPLYPPGITITLPDLPTQPKTPTKQTIHLWD